MWPIPNIPQSPARFVLTSYGLLVLDVTGYLPFSGGATHFLRPLRSREQDRNYQFVGADYGGFGRAGLRAGTAANCAAIIGGV